MTFLENTKTKAKKVRIFFRLIWIFTRALFRIDLNSLTVSRKDGDSSINFKDPKSFGAYQLKRFLELYNVDREDMVDYTNTHKDHHSNFSYLDDVHNKRHYDEEGEARVKLQVGLIYEEDGKTPKNAAEVFDMTYEEYSDYKKTILPQAQEIKITYKEIETFINNKRK